MIQANIGSETASIAPLAPMQSGQGVGVQDALEVELPETEKIKNKGIVEPHSNFCVDPLAYYCAFALIGGIDEMVTGGGYCQVGEVRYCDLDEIIRAWGELEATRANP